MTRSLFFHFVVVLSALGADAWNETRACSVPVFRYALERWKASPYQVDVFHRGPLSEAQLASLKQLENAAQQANLTITTIDLDGELTGEQQTLWKLRGDESALPRVIVRYPDEEAEAEPLCVGRLEEAFVRSLIDSPARQRLVDLLCAGESAVWVLLDSGDRRADDAVAALLERELARLNDELHLPEQDQRDLLSTTTPLKISFVMIRVSRDDPREARLVDQLLGSEEDLRSVKGPIVFPVFGRGRVRLALSGEKLRPTEIERWASSLCGPCSCVVKELNPGVDLLLSADWDERLQLDPLPEERPKPAAPPIPPGIRPEAEPESPSEQPIRFPWFLIAGAAGVVVLALAMVWRDRRSTVA